LRGILFSGKEDWRTLYPASGCAPCAWARFETSFGICHQADFVLMMTKYGEQKPKESVQALTSGGI